MLQLRTSAVNRCAYFVAKQSASAHSNDGALRCHCHCHTDNQRAHQRLSNPDRRVQGVRADQRFCMD